MQRAIEQSCRRSNLQLTLLSKGVSKPILSFAACARNADLTENEETITDVRNCCLLLSLAPSGNIHIGRSAHSRSSACGRTPDLWHYALELKGKPRAFILRHK